MNKKNNSQEIKGRDIRQMLTGIAIGNGEL